MNKETFELARQRFLESCKLSDEAMEALMDQEELKPYDFRKVKI